ncbi:MAG TPA: hypothetical protein VMC80_00370 [Patescibacteria group bacterium]|nr:hypothetical protein [Patescibacteria group bacterium]
MPREKRGEGESSMKVKGNSFGAAGFTLGIMSILYLGYMGIVTALLGFIFCFFQFKGKRTKLSKAGLIISAIGIILGILSIIFAPMINSYVQSLAK